MIEGDIVIEVNHREYIISMKELKTVFGIKGDVNTVEFDYGKMELVLKMVVESEERNTTYHM